MIGALRIFLFVALVPLLGSGVVAQSAASAAQNADELRLQLLEIETKEVELQNRARQLDEGLKPENIERSLAGVGSTKPEELRELRRRQLSIEREGVQKQLTLLATSRERLELALRTAENTSYQKSAEGTSIPSTQRFGTTARPGWLLGILGGFVALLGIILVAVFIRRSSV